MTPPAYEGSERRTDSVSVRLALLEQAVAAAKDRDSDTQKSLAAVHKRISETRDKISQDVKEGFAAVIKKMDDQKTAQDLACKDCAADISTLKEGKRWTYGWILAAWGAIVSIGGWIFAHATNNPAAVNQGLDVAKKIKGGG